jgi:hypothetical protein
MIHIFKDNYSYINYITKNEIICNEIFCTNFIPSAFFPKDIINYYFEKKDHIAQHKEASEKLWSYGCNVLKSLKQNKMEIGIEFDSIIQFIENSIVHKAFKKYEVSLPIKILILENLIEYSDNIYFFSEPVPFIYRLIPPDIIVIDVDSNLAQQKIQGIKLQDKFAYDDFFNEFSRLKATSHNKDKILSILDESKMELKGGIRPKIKI